MERLTILDTTLRDGDQAAGAALKPQEKLLIARQLERLKVDVIEAGFPAVSETELSAVREISRSVLDCRVCAFARAVPWDIERAGEAVRDAQAPRVEVAIPVSDLQMERQPRKNREQVIELTGGSVRLARKFEEEQVSGRGAAHPE